MRYTDLLMVTAAISMLCLVTTCSHPAMAQTAQYQTYDANANRAVAKRHVRKARVLHRRGFKKRKPIIDAAPARSYQHQPAPERILERPQGDFPTDLSMQAVELVQPKPTKVKTFEYIGPLPAVRTMPVTVASLGAPRIAKEKIPSALLAGFTAAAFSVLFFWAVGRKYHGKFNKGYREETPPDGGQKDADAVRPKFIKLPVGEVTVSERTRGGDNGVGHTGDIQALGNGYSPDSALGAFGCLQEECFLDDLIRTERAYIEAGRVSPSQGYRRPDRDARESVGCDRGK